MIRDNQYLEKTSREEADAEKPESAGLGFGIMANVKWFLSEQQKIILFNEGVFIFMLSLALMVNQLTPMLWVFAISQLYYGLARGLQRGLQIEQDQKVSFEK